MPVHPQDMGPIRGGVAKPAAEVVVELQGVRHVPDQAAAKAAEEAKARERELAGFAGAAGDKDAKDPSLRLLERGVGMPERPAAGDVDLVAQLAAIIRKLEHVPDREFIKVC